MAASIKGSWIQEGNGWFLTGQLCCSPACRYDSLLFCRPSLHHLPGEYLTSKSWGSVEEDVSPSGKELHSLQPVEKKKKKKKMLGWHFCQTAGNRPAALFRLWPKLHTTRCFSAAVSMSKYLQHIQENDWHCWTVGSCMERQISSMLCSSSMCVRMFFHSHTCLEWSTINQIKKQYFHCVSGPKQSLPYIKYSVIAYSSCTVLGWAVQSRGQMSHGEWSQREAQWTDIWRNRCALNECYYSLNGHLHINHTD